MEDLRDAKNRFTESVPSSTVSGFKSAGIDFLPGRATFGDPQTISVDGQATSARFIVLATGARPMALPLDGAHHIVTSDAFMELERLPREIIFIGGGFISFEFAHFAVRLGSAGTRCTILEAGPRALGPFDEEMVDLLTRVLIRLDLPTFERPANAISGYFTGGYWSGLTALVINSADFMFMAARTG